MKLEEIIKFCQSNFIENVIVANASVKIVEKPFKTLSLTQTLNQVSR